MKDKKNILIIVLIAVVLILLILVVYKYSTKLEVITPKEFTKEFTSMGYKVVDKTKEEASDQKSVKKLLIAASANYQIEYYQFDNNKNTLYAYLNSEKYFDTNRGKNAKDDLIQKDNYAKYQITSESDYNVVVRLKNTLIYASVAKKYKNDIVKALKEINY